MFSHVFVSVTDFEKSLAFYSKLMQVLGNEQRFVDAAKPWAGWHTDGRSRPYFVFCKPFDGRPHHPGNGQMVASLARGRATVDAAHHAALQSGGTCEGPPGLRPYYHDHCYGAYFRDPDGNRVCVAHHGP